MKNFACVDRRWQQVKIKERDSPIILLLEEIEETRDCIKKLLERDGYRIQESRNEDSAIESARRTPPDLILVCIEGLINDIVAVGRRIRTRAELSDDTAVVVFRCETINENEKVSVEDDIYVISPNNFNQLRQFLNRLLQQRL